MLLRLFYDDTLAQASYLIGCQATGEALVVDPNRDADAYLAAAEAEGVRIAFVTETHIHADYASGSRELAARAGATLLLSDEGGPDWRYAFAEADGATLLRDGDRFSVGHIEVEVMHTPGHTPEHLSFVVTDGATTGEPMGILSGDFIFVGDVGRPDLLERAAGLAGTMEASARQLFESLQRVRDLPGHLQVWPGHGAGSACGKALGAVPSSTLGYERLVNWAFGHDEEAGFVGAVLEDQPEPPRYFATMKHLNRVGPPILGGLTEPECLEASRLPDVLAEGGIVVDCREREAFAAGHIPGTLLVPLNRSFCTWAGSLLPYDRPIHLLAPSRAAAVEAARRLAFIGLDRVAGYFGSEAFAEATLAEADVVSVQRAHELHREGGFLLDIRRATEWRAGHVPGAHHRYLGALVEDRSGLPDDTAVLLLCRSGARSAIAQSLLLAEGRRAINVEGGIEAWIGEGLPVGR